MDAEQIVVRAAVPADLPDVAAIYAYYVTTSVTTFEEIPPTPADWRLRLDDLADRKLPFLVAEAADRSIGGYAFASPLLSACAEAGARQVIAVIVDTGSDASLALHRRLGFAQAGRLSNVGHKHGQWLDTVLMQRALGAKG